MSNKGGDRRSDFSRIKPSEAYPPEHRVKFFAGGETPPLSLHSSAYFPNPIRYVIKSSNSFTVS